MCNITFVRWISHAVVRFSGTRGAVSIQATRVGCSRQAIYDQAKKVHTAVQEYSEGRTREELIRENQVLREQNAQLWAWVDQAVEFTVAIQQRFCDGRLGHGAESASNPRLDGRAPGTVSGRLAVHDWSLVPSRRFGGRQGPQTIGCSLQGFGTGRLSR